MSRRLTFAFAALALTACSQPAQKAADTPAAPAPVPAPATTEAPAGRYLLDLSHSSVNFRVDHVGLSRYVARFTDIQGALDFDPAAPEKSVVDITIAAKSLQTNYPDKATLDFDAQVSGPEFLDRAKFPTITFKSTKIERTGANTAKVTGDFTLHGVTRPIVLDTTFNGGYALGKMDPTAARIGFSATTTINRSDYGIGYGIPAPGTKMGVSDAVEVLIETEFTQK